MLLGRWSSVGVVAGQVVRDLGQARKDHSKLVQTWESRHSIMQNSSRAGLLLGARNLVQTGKRPSMLKTAVTMENLREQNQASRLQISSKYDSGESVAVSHAQDQVQTTQVQAGRAIEATKIGLHEQDPRQTRQALSRCSCAMPEALSHERSLELAEQCLDE